MPSAPALGERLRLSGPHPDEEQDLGCDLPRCSSQACAVCGRRQAQNDGPLSIREGDGPCRLLWRGACPSSSSPGLVAHATLARLSALWPGVEMKTWTRHAPAVRATAVRLLVVPDARCGGPGGPWPQGSKAAMRLAAGPQAPPLTPYRKVSQKAPTSLPPRARRARCEVARDAKQPQEALCVFLSTPPAQHS